MRLGVLTGEPGELPWVRIRRTFLWVMIGVAAVFALRHLQNPPLWDEAVFLSSAETLGQSDPYFSDIDYRPPLLVILLRSVSYVIPLPAGARILGALLFIAGILLIMRLGTILWGEAEGLFAAVMLATAPFFLGWSGAALSDVPSATLAIATVYLAYLGAERRPWYAFAGGVMLAAAFLMRWPTIFVGAAAVALVATGALRIRHALAYGAGFIAGVAPYFAWAWIRFSNPLEPFVRAASAIEGSEPVPDLGFYAISILLLSAPLTLAGLLFYMVGLWKDDIRVWLRTDFPLFVWAIALPVYLTTLEHKEERYVAAAIPPLFLLAARGWVRALRHRDYAWRVPLAVLAAVAFAVMWFNFDRFMIESSTKKDHLAVAADIDKAAPLIQNAVPRGGVVYSNHLWPVVAWATKLKTIALWPRDERFFTYYPDNMPEDGLFIHVSGVAKEPSIQWLDSQERFRRRETVGRITIYEYLVPLGALPPEEMRELVGTAREAYKRGDWAAAATALDRLGGGEAGVGCIKGWSLYKVGDIESARQAFDELLAVSPEDNCGLTGSGYTSLRRGEHALAETLFRRVLEDDPTSTDVLFGLGLAVMRQDRKHEAAALFRNVLEINPQHSEAREFLERVELSAAGDGG